MHDDVVAFFNLPAAAWQAHAYGNGLINRTFLLSAGQVPQRYILQEINTAVFKQPRVIDANLRAMAITFASRFPAELFIAPLANLSGETMFHHPGKTAWVRLFPFVEGSFTHDTVPSAKVAYEAARQFGIFASQLAHVPMLGIQPSIPDFHNLALREQQFADSLKHGSSERLRACAEEITALQASAYIGVEVAAAQRGGSLRQRLMHHDTKISNVLFDARSQTAVCAIDLDTVMPGTFLSDVGDMMRTYLCPHDENHTALGDLHVRGEIYSAIQSGYLDAMQNTLNAAEQALFPLAGKFMIYMQALRFLTDHINRDVYYGARHPGQNLERARNQITLLQRYCEFVANV